MLAFALTGPSSALQTEDAAPAGTLRQFVARDEEAAAASSWRGEGPRARPRIDTLAQQQFLATEEWKTTASDFEQWLNTQMFYDEERTAETRARFAVGVERMSAEQLQTFMVGLQAKLEILYSTLAQDAETYLIEKAAVASAAYMKRIREQDAGRINGQCSANQSAIGCSGGAPAEVAATRNSVSTTAGNSAWSPTRPACNSDKKRMSAVVERRGRAPGVVSSKAENDFQPRDYAPHNRDPGGFGIPGMMGFGVGAVGVVW